MPCRTWTVPLALLLLVALLTAGCQTASVTETYRRSPATTTTGSATTATVRASDCLPLACPRCGAPFCLGPLRPGERVATQCPACGCALLVEVPR